MVEDSFRCSCDFCTGKKRWEDNWCARCGDVQLTPPEWWENYNVCDTCEKEMEQERNAPPVEEE